jgi:hypothetical protein
MPIHWTINHSDRLVVAICQDEVTRMDIEDYLDKVVVADALPYAKIFDTTDGALVLSDEDMMTLGARIRAYAGISHIGPLALVAASPENVDRARLFVTLADANRPVRIFSKLSAASRWANKQADPAEKRDSSSPQPTHELRIWLAGKVLHQSTARAAISDSHDELDTAQED